MPGQQQDASLTAWLLTWLRLLSTTNLASSAAAVGAAVAAAQRDLQVVLSALLPAGRQQREAAAGSSGVSVGVDAWLPLVVQAAADVQGGEDENGEGEDGEREQEDVQSEGEACGWCYKQVGSGRYYLPDTSSSPAHHASSMMCAVTRTEGERVRMGRLSRTGCMKMCNLMGRLGVVLQLGSGTMVRNILEA